MQIFKCGKMTIICKSESTRSGFRHVATLFLGGFGRDTAKCCYLNRTWERFEFETVILKLLEKTTMLTARSKAAFRKKLFSNRLGNFYIIGEKLC